MVSVNVPNYIVCSSLLSSTPYFHYSGVVSPGAIVGIIFGLLLLLVLGVIVVVAAVYLVKHRRATGKEHSTEDNVPAQNFREYMQLSMFLVEQGNNFKLISTMQTI